MEQCHQGGFDAWLDGCDIDWTTHGPLQRHIMQPDIRDLRIGRRGQTISAFVHHLETQALEQRHALRERDGFLP